MDKVRGTSMEAAARVHQANASTRHWLFTQFRCPRAMNCRLPCRPKGGEPPGRAFISNLEDDALLKSWML